MKDCDGLKKERNKIEVVLDLMQEQNFAHSVPSTSFSPNRCVQHNTLPKSSRDHRTAKKRENFYLDMNPRGLHIYIAKNLSSFYKNFFRYAHQFSAEFVSSSLISISSMISWMPIKEFLDQNKPARGWVGRCLVFLAYGIEQSMLTYERAAMTAPLVTTDDFSTRKKTDVGAVIYLCSILIALIKKLFDDLHSLSSVVLMDESGLEREKDSTHDYRRSRGHPRIQPALTLIILQFAEGPMRTVQSCSTAKYALEKLYLRYAGKVTINKLGFLNGSLNMKMKKGE